MDCRHQWDLRNAIARPNQDPAWYPPFPPSSGTVLEVFILQLIRGIFDETFGLPDAVTEPVAVAAGTDLAHALDFVVVHGVAVVAAVAAMVDADVDVNARVRLAPPHPAVYHPVVLAMVVTDLSTAEKETRANGWRTLNSIEK